MARCTLTFPEGQVYESIMRACSSPLAKASSSPRPDTRRILAWWNLQGREPPPLLTTSCTSALNSGERSGVVALALLAPALLPMLMLMVLDAQGYVLRGEVEPGVALGERVERIPFAQDVPEVHPLLQTRHRRLEDSQEGPHTLRLGRAPHRGLLGDVLLPDFQ